MSKDYKQSSKKPAASGSKRSGGGGSVFAGVFIGLCLGIAIAVGAAMYLNKTPNPFGSRVASPPAPASANKPAAVQPEILAPNAAGKPATSPGSAPTANPNAPAGQTKPQGDRFKFYEMLPELGSDQKHPAPVAVKPADATPPALVQPAKGSYLQVGAFQNETDADNLKAKLALLGVEANIQTSQVADKGVMHRVRVGPLVQPDDIDRVRAQLKVNGIDANLVKQ